MRRLIAGSQLAGGLVLASIPALSAVQGMQFHLWYWILVQSLAGVTIAAGWWLWHSDPRGWQLSILVQSFQILQLQSSSLVLGFDAGLLLKLNISATELAVEPGFFGAVQILGGEMMRWRTSIDLFALLAAVWLVRNAPTLARSSAMPDQQPQCSATDLPQSR